MEYRQLGATDMKVSVVGFGASPLGGVFGEVDLAQCIRTVHCALDNGINFIDVSPYYGLTRAETVLGRALSGISRDRFYLATKVGRYGVDSFDFSAARVTRSVDESLQRLGVDYFDIVQCHDIEFGSIAQVISETLPALRDLRERGKIRYIGVTGLPLKIFRLVVPETPIDTVLSYCHYSLNDDALVDLMPLLGQSGVGVINASPMSMGLLTMQGPPAWHPADERTKLTCANAARACAERGIDIAEIAMRFSLSHPHVATTLVGTANPEHIEKNIRWAESPADREAQAFVLALLAPIHNRTWQSGRPENN